MKQISGNGWMAVVEYKNVICILYFSTEGQINQKIDEKMNTLAKSLDLPASGDQTNTRLVIAQMER